MSFFLRRYPCEGFEKSVVRKLCFTIAQAVQNQLPPVFTSYDIAKLADGIYVFISPEATGTFVSGNSLLIIGSESALVVDSGTFRASQNG